MMEKKRVEDFLKNFIWFIHPIISLKLVQRNVSYKRIMFH